MHTHTKIRFWRFDKIARMRDPRQRRVDREGDTDADGRPDARGTRKQKSKIIVQKDSWDCCSTHRLTPPPSERKSA